MSAIKYVVVSKETGFYDRIAGRISSESREIEVTRVDTMREGVALGEESGTVVILTDLSALEQQFPLFVPEEHLRDAVPDFQNSRVKADIGAVKLYIRMHLGEDLSLQNLSRQACLSPNYLSALFKQREGVSLRNYIEKNRMEMAAYLILTEDSMIEEISERVGYSHCSYFCRAFKKYYDISPLQYRIRARAEEEMRRRDVL